MPRENLNAVFIKYSIILGVYVLMSGKEERWEPSIQGFVIVLERILHHVTTATPCFIKSHQRNRKVR